MSHVKILLLVVPVLLVTLTWIEYPVGATPAATVTNPAVLIVNPAGGLTSSHPVREPLLLVTYAEASNDWGSVSSLSD